MNISTGIALALMGFAGAAIATPASAACLPGPYITASSNRSYTDTVAAGRMALQVNNRMYSKSGNYYLTFQGDGNLVLYSSGGAVKWSPNVQNCIPTPYDAYQTVFQGDGNLVVYYTKHNDPSQMVPAWSSHTYGHPNATLAVQDDGNLVIYDGNKVLFAVF